MRITFILWLGYALQGFSQTTPTSSADIQPNSSQQPLISTSILKEAPHATTSDSISVETNNQTIDVNITPTQSSFPESEPSSSSENGTQKEDATQTTVEYTEPPPPSDILSQSNDGSIPELSTTGHEPTASAEQVNSSSQHLAESSSLPEPSSPPELLSFNDWREKYVVAPDPAIRRPKKATKSKLDVGADEKADVKDGDGSEKGKEAFGGEKNASRGIATEQGGIEDHERDAQPNATREDKATKDSPGKLQDKESVVEKEDDNNVKGFSPIQPLPNVGSGDISDPLLELKDRSNYALFECSAAVHRSSKGSKGAPSILVEKKDRYMLTPCSVTQKFVELELCDEIQIDTIAVANFEFFSSMFKHFSIKVSVNYPGRAEDWEDIGLFRARNVRGVQVFHPKALPNFYRYMRIDFISHYGSEYFCPVSLLRVYGITQMDAFRREDQQRMKALKEEEAMTSVIHEEQDEEDEEEALLRLIAVEDGSAELVEPLAQNLETASTNGSDPSSDSRLSRSDAQVQTASPVDITQAPTVVESNLPHSATTVQRATNTFTTHDVPSSSSSTLEVPVTEAPRSLLPLFSNASIPTDSVPPPLQTSTATDSGAQATGLDSMLPTDALSQSAQRQAETTTSQPPPLTSKTPEAMTTIIPSAPVQSVDSKSPILSSEKSDVISATKSATASSESADSSVSSTPPSATGNVSIEADATGAGPITRNDARGMPTPVNIRNDTRNSLPLPIAAAPIPSTGESIYGTIMKRLTSLEQNQTISMYFIEAQSEILRDAFARVEKRLGDFEATRNDRDQALRLALVDLEKARVDMRRELSAQVKLLTQEVTFERRLGLVQLVGLLLLFVFVGLTRGTPSIPLQHFVAKEVRKRFDSSADRRRSEESVVSLQSQLAGSDGEVDPLKVSRNPSVSLLRSSSAKRFPTSAPRRHYGVAGPSKTPKVRSWTPPPRVSDSAPPEDLFYPPQSSSSSFAPRTAGDFSRRRGSKIRDPSFLSPSPFVLGNRRHSKHDFGTFRISTSGQNIGAIENEKNDQEAISDADAEDERGWSPRGSLEDPRYADDGYGTMSGSEADVGGTLFRNGLGHGIDRDMDGMMRSEDESALESLVLPEPLDLLPIAPPEDSGRTEGVFIKEEDLS